ncbi:MAG: 50S ribosomal protein L1 [Elusimicrobia bacterium]|nr:50S ribosomal protein L1 [Elusimicrobiota bacterium]
MGKRLEAAVKNIEKDKLYTLSEAAALVKKCASAKFPESVELHVRLGIDPKQSDQMVRSSVILPHGTGKTRRVGVVSKGEKLKEAQEAGADVVGSTELAEEIAKGRMDFDVLVATPDMMKDLSKLGKILGPRGLMPNPKSGTVTFEVAKAVKELKGGRVEFKNDEYGIIHLGIGKVSFAPEQLAENAKVVIDLVLKIKPAAAKGTYIKSVALSSTMGPGIPVSTSF